MTEYRLYSLAWDHAMILWMKSREDLEAFPNNGIIKARVEKYWKEQEELHTKLLELEKIEEERKPFLSIN